MIAVWYDTDCDQVWIAGVAAPYPARTLFAERAGDLVTIRRKGQTMAEVAAPFDQFTDHAGAGFPGAETALAYLAEVLGRWPEASGVTVMTAAVPLGGHRVVRADRPGAVALADASVLDHAGRLVGLTLAAAEAGRPINVRAGGPVEEPSWRLTPGPVFLGAEGALTQVAPTQGFICQVGTALTPTRMLVALGEPYILAS